MITWGIRFVIRFLPVASLPVWRFEQPAMGIANGLGEKPTWVFQLNSHEDNVLVFHQ